MSQVSSIPGLQPHYPPVFGKQEAVVPPNAPVPIVGEAVPV